MMKYALVDFNGIVQNIVVYDGSSVYTPPAGLKLTKVNDWLNIGDHISKESPSNSVGE